MKIGFDARMVTHPGIGRYIRNLLNAMLLQQDDCEFFLYGNPVALKDFSAKCNIVEYITPIYSLNEFFANPFEKDKLDLVHIPHFNIPFQPKKKAIITIHDFIYLKFPEAAPDYLKNIAVWVAISNAVKKSDIIIAVSENTKKDIIEKFPYAQEKVRVIYEAADPEFGVIDDADKKENICRKYNLRNGIILFVGSVRPHKNIEGLIDAWSSLKAKGAKEDLVIVGRKSSHSTSILKKAEGAGVLYLGEVAHEELLLLYNISRLLVIPSFYEGFGLPVLEAFACACPVASSKVSSLPEIAGDAALFFDPYNTEDIADKIGKILNSEELRKDLIQKGLRRNALFSWQKAARETIDLYKDLI